MRIKIFNSFYRERERERERERDEFAAGVNPKNFVFCIKNKPLLLI